MKIARQAVRMIAGALFLHGVGWLTLGPQQLRAHDPTSQEPSQTDKAAAAGADEQTSPGARDYDYEPPAPGSYHLPPIKRAGDGAVLDEKGKPRRLSALLSGRITLLAFIYTRCADPSGCPLSLSLLYELHDRSRQDSALRDNLQLVTLSFDPAYDTPEVMAMHAAAVSELGEGAPWHFLTSESQAALQPILQAYDQPVGLKTNLDDPLGPYTHQLRVFLIDREAKIRNIYSLGFLDPRLVLNDVRTLLLEEAGQGSEG